MIFGMQNMMPSELYGSQMNRGGMNLMQSAGQPYLPQVNAALVQQANQEKPKKPMDLSGLLASFRQNQVPQQQGMQQPMQAPISSPAQFRPSLDVMRQIYG